MEKLAQKRSRRRWGRDQRGQALTEYILLLAIVVGMAVGVIRSLQKSDLNKQVHAMVGDEFKRTYQYGHPKVKGPDEKEGPEHHPRFTQGGKNFRIFRNVGKNE